MKKYLFLLTIFIWPLLVFAQSDYSEMVTDRPDQTESAQVVPLKNLQIETGFVREFNKKGKISYVDYAFNSTLLRYGLLKSLELRLGIEYLGARIDYLLDDPITISGFGGLFSGVKYRILEEDGSKPGIAVLANLVFPFTANDRYKTDHTAAGLCLALSQSLSDKLSIGYNLGTEWDGNSNTAVWFYSVSMGIPLTSRLGMFIESYGFIPNWDKAAHLADAGFTYLILPNLQADLSAGLGLNDPATDHFISFGVSYRVPGPKKSD